MPLVDGFDGALKAAEEGLRAQERAGEVDCVREFVDWEVLLARRKLLRSTTWGKGGGEVGYTVFQDLVEMLQVLHDDVAMFL